MLRSGYTTGACAAAASKAAVHYLLALSALEEVTIPFPEGQRVSFTVHSSELLTDDFLAASATIIKDAGDDPDVTNGIELKVIASYETCEGIVLDDNFILCGGEGVGTVTKPGLAVDIGEPAINPVPRQMIKEAVNEVLVKFKPDTTKQIFITVTVPEGRKVAEKTLNQRLGILGGISILGTTGIVKPISSKAWTDTIITSMQVAEANNIKEIVISTGRTSEKALQLSCQLPEESFIMMGDYLEFTLKQANNYTFTKIIYSGMWGKVLKGAMGSNNTHVRNGALSVADTFEFLQKAGLGKEHEQALKLCNSAREIYDHLLRINGTGLIHEVCRIAAERFSRISGKPVELVLVTPKQEIAVRVNS